MKSNFEKIRKPNRDKDFEYTYKKKVEVKLRRDKKNKYAARMPKEDYSV